MISSCIRSSARVALRASSAQSVARYGALRGAYLGMRFFSNDLSKDSVVTKYASTTPKVKYTEEHEWIALHEDGVGKFYWRLNSYKGWAYGLI